MSPEKTHKFMGFYMEGLLLGVNTMYMLFCSFKLFLIGCMGLITYCSIKCSFPGLIMNYRSCTIHHNYYYFPKRVGGLPLMSWNVLKRLPSDGFERPQLYMATRMYYANCLQNAEIKAWERAQRHTSLWPRQTRNDQYFYKCLP